MVQHAETENKTVHIVNLDPAAEFFDYNPFADIRELIHIEDAMEDEEMRFGPNGGLIFCMEYVQSTGIMIACSTRASLMRQNFSDIY